MKKYIIVAGFNVLYLLLAEDNPFSINEYLQKLDQEKTVFLNTLHEAGKSSHDVSSKSNQVKKVSTGIPKKPLFSSNVKQSVATSPQLRQHQQEIQKRIAKAKKIRKERANALRIKKHAEEIRRIEKAKLEKLAKEKREAKERKKMEIKNAKIDSKQFIKKTIHKVEEKRQSRLPKGKDLFLEKKEAVDQVYLDAIKAVNK